MRKWILLTAVCVFILNGCVRSERLNEVKESEDIFSENYSEKQESKESESGSSQNEVLSEESPTDVSKIPIEEEPYIVKWSEISAKAREENTYILS